VLLICAGPDSALVVDVKTFLTRIKSERLKMQKVGGGVPRWLRNLAGAAQFSQRMNSGTDQLLVLFGIAE